MVWLPAVLIAVLSALLVRAARRLALNRALLDIPNERSLHKLPVPRLGGVAFVPVVLLAAASLAPRQALPGWVLAVFVGGAVVLFLVSLTDDIVTLSTVLRLTVQVAVAGAFLLAVDRAWPTDPGSVSGYTLLPGWSHPGLALLVFWIVGMMNIYNFMDGADGLAGIQGVVAGVSWWIIGRHYGAPFVATLGMSVAAGALGFLTLNWCPAKIFLGDAGSTVLGYIFAAMPLLLLVEGGASVSCERALFAGLLIVWPFAADGAFTLLRRARNGENIFRAHRSHLFQRLILSGVTHQRVSCIYGAMAALGGALAWGVVSGLQLAQPCAVALSLADFLCLWRWVVLLERKAS